MDYPRLIGKSQELLDYLKMELDNKDKELFIVVNNEIDKNQSWLLDKSAYSSHLLEREAEVIQLNDIISDELNITINPLCNNYDWSVYSSIFDKRDKLTTVQTIDNSKNCIT